MISYEKVRQALKTSTIAIIILNGLGVVLSLMGFAGFSTYKANSRMKHFGPN